MGSQHVPADPRRVRDAPTVVYSGIALAIVTAIVVVVVNVASGLSTIELGTELIDTDGYMRYSRILDLVQGRDGWFDGWVAWSNTPFGHDMHWTRPLDAVVIAISAPMAPFLGWSRAVYWGAIVTAPLIALFLAASVAWAARAVTNPRGAVLAALAASLQPVIVSYARVGRLDHHILILAVSVIVAGAALHMLRTTSPGHHARIFGIAAAVAIWISPESLVMVALAVVALGVAWIAGALPINAVVRASRWMALATLAAAIIERGPWDLTAIEYDRISLPYLVISGFFCLGSQLLAIVERRRESITTRVIAAGATAAVGALATRAMFPLILEGPFAGLPDRMFDEWLDGIMESQPVWSGPSGAVRFVFQLGMPIVVLVVLVTLGLRRRLPQPTATWLALTGWLVVFVPLAASSMRFTIYPEALAAIPVGAWIASRLESTRTRRFPVLSRFGWVLLCACGYVLPALVVQRIVDPVEQPDPLSECPIEPMAEQVGTLIETDKSDSPHRWAVYTDLDDGPALHVLAGVDVLATPHHRNIDGILTSFELMRLPPGETGNELTVRGIDVVLVCPQRDERRFGSVEGTTLDALINGPLPEWAQPVPSDHPEWMIFSVTGSG